MSVESIKTVVRIQISEPWDFEVPGRGNVINGLVEGSCHGPEEKNWRGQYLLVVLSEILDWEGQEVCQILVSPRYAEDTTDDILKGKRVVVGIARVRPSIRLKASGTFTPQQVEYFAIGSIQKS